MAVTYDATGAGASVASGTASWSHTTVAASTFVLAGATYDIGTDTGKTMSCTCDGTPMTSVAGPVHTNNSTAGFLNAWWISGITAGAHTIVVTGTAGFISMSGNSMSLAGGTVLGTPPTPTFGSGTAVSIATATSTATGIVVGFTDAGSSYTGTTSPAVSRFTIGSGSSGAGFMEGATSAGTGSAVTMAWTINNDFWAAIAVEVQSGTTLSVNAAVAAAAGSGLAASTIPYSLSSAMAHATAVAVLPGGYATWGTPEYAEGGP